MQNSVELCSSERLLQPLCNPYVNYGQLCFWLFTISFYGKMTGLLMNPQCHVSTCLCTTTT